MRSCTPALKSYLDGIRVAQGGGTMIMVDCYTFTLTSGLVLRYCDKDVPVTVGGVMFAANGVRVSGLRYKCEVGLDVDTQELDIVAGPGDMAGGIPFLVAMRYGAFDGCAVTRDRAFFASHPAGVFAAIQAPAIGSINLFTGQIATIDALGRTTARVTVASMLTLLDIDMPRNVYQPNCNHTLFDTGCGLSKAAYATPGSVATGSTSAMILSSAAAATFTQGTLTMTSGRLAGFSTGVKTAGNGQIILTIPFPFAPSAGDAFLIYPGCDHTRGAQGCAKFANLANFRGFPYIPPATSTYSGAGG